MSQVNQTAGLVVLRLPSLNKEPSGQYSLPKQAPRINSIYYGGIDRMAWFDLDEDFYHGVLPSNIQQARQLIKSNNVDFTGIDLCKDWALTIELLEYSNRHFLANELIAIRSELLNEIKGVAYIDTLEISWVGYDIVSLGNWSLLYAGLFTSPEYFAEWQYLVNSCGLFSSPTHCSEYIQAYRIAAGQGVVEELPDSPYGIDIIEIGKVDTNSFAGSGSYSSD